MFKTLFRYPRVSARHANGPLANERRTFLSHLQTQGVPSSTLLRYASQLLLVAGMLIRKGHAQVARADISCCAKRWAQRQRQRGRAHTQKWSAERFAQVACAWYSFLGWLEDDSPPKPPYGCQLASWASFLRSEGLSESTSYTYRWWTSGFLEWLTHKDLRLRQLTPTTVDGFMEHLSAKGLRRVSLLTAAKVLRRFLHYAHGQGWCQRDLAQAILSPRLFRQE